MPNIQVGTNLRNCKITLVGTISYGDSGIEYEIFTFTNNSIDYIKSDYNSTTMPPKMDVYGGGIFSSVWYLNQYSDVIINQTFDIPNDKDYIVETLDSSFTTAIYEPLTSNIQIPITKNGTTTLATKGTKNEEDIDINVNISPTIQSLSITPSETSQTFNASNVDGYKPVTVSAISTETPTVTLSLASGNQTVNASSGKYIKSLTITKPSTLIASNIRSGVSIAGVSGSLSPAKTEQTKSTTITENGTTTITPDSGKVLSSVSVTTNVPTYITVASESALPSTAEEGTIAVIGGGVAMYSVSVSEFDPITYPTQFFYSIDNGENWEEITGTGLLTSEATQLKFRITYSDREVQPSGSISSVQAGISASYSISDLGYQTADEQSENVTLTQNITDIICH